MAGQLQAVRRSTASTRPAATNDAGRQARVTAASVTVYVLSVGIALVEVGRVGLFESGFRLAVAAAATVLFLPMHVWHLGYGLRGERPPHAGTTLAFMAVVHVVALLLVGPAWSFMLAVLATSALIVLRPAWALAVLVACASAPVLVQPLDNGPTEYFSHTGYLVYAMVMRAGIFFAIVWLAAAVYQLVGSEAALETEAMEQERALLQASVRAALADRLTELPEAARAARRTILASHAAAGPALRRICSLAQESQADLRQVVAGTRSATEQPAARALEQRARFGRTPIGRGVAVRQAWWTFVAVHVLVFGFVLLLGLGFIVPQFDARPVPAVLATAALAGLQVPVSIAVARGRRVSMPVLRVVATIAVLVLTLWLVGAYMEFAFLVVASMGLLCLPRRWGVVVFVAEFVAYVLFDTVVYTLGYPGVDPVLLVTWNVFAAVAINVLLVVGVCACAWLVATVTELDLTFAELAESVRDDERRRLSRDLHDVLGQALAAISLKGDLATRLLGRDDAAAAREADDVATIADSLVGEIETVAHGVRTVSFRAETEAAVRLLREAGVEVTVEVGVGELDEDADGLLGWAVRESATNILRHSTARTCGIRASRHDLALRLEVVNDGAGPAQPSGGTGLAALAERVATYRGSVHAGPSADGTFTLTVELPC